MIGGNVAKGDLLKLKGSGAPMAARVMRGLAEAGTRTPPLARCGAREARLLDMVVFPCFSSRSQFKGGSLPGP